MHAINLYTLSREVDDKILTLYERLLSDRDPSIKIHKKEVEIVKRIVEAFIANKADDLFMKTGFIHLQYHK